MTLRGSKKAIVFGAGSIGRGFLGRLFNESGYEVVFVDINQRLVDCLNRRQSYTLRIVDNEFAQELTIYNVRAVDGHDMAQMTREVVEADIGATAVGAHALPQIAPAVAKGIARRSVIGVDKPLNILLAENLKNAAQIFRDMVLTYLPAKHLGYLQEKVGFVDTVIGIMVPVMPPEIREQDPSLIMVEPYKGKLFVNRAGFVGEVPAIAGMEAYDYFGACVDRKLFIHNASHAILAYLGYQKGYKYIYEAVADPQVYALCTQAMDESSRALIAKYGFNPAKQQAYIKDLIKRYHNRALGDTIFRVGRDPIRKLGPRERLVGPATLALEYGIEPDGLCWGIAAALAYDEQRDEEAVELQRRLLNEGLDNVLQSVGGIDPASHLAEMVRDRYRLVKERW